MKLSGHGFDFSASEKGWEFTLNWIGTHPYIFALFLGFLLVALLVWRSGSVQLQRAKSEYNLARVQARNAAPQQGLLFDQRPHDPDGEADAK